jgi:hypothetical protein
MDIAINGGNEAKLALAFHNEQTSCRFSVNWNMAKH